MSACRCRRAITRFLDATGNTAPIKSVDLVARVQGVLQSINYKDGSFVKQGTTLFTIEPETYKLKLEQAQAAEAGAQASLKQAEADYKRQVDLVARQAVSQATLDTSTSTRDNAQANLQQAAGQHQDRRGQLRLYQCRRAVRRHRQRASGLGRRTRRRGVADPARDHRAARPDLREFQRQRTGRAADPRRSHAAGIDVERSRADCRSRSGCRPKTVFRTRASSIMRRRPSISRRERSRCAACCRIPTAYCCPAISFGSAFPSISSRTRCWCPTSRSAAIRPDAMCWW